MLFHTLEFFLLFALVLPFGIWAPNRLRQIVFFIASLVFYMWFSIPLVGLMLATAGIDYYLGKTIDASSNEQQRRRLLVVSIISNLGVLFIFKYFNWFSGNINSLCFALTGKHPLPHWDIVLPLGISFYTFQSLSYTIDIYRRKLKPAQDPLLFLLYVTFFPQLVAGPIVRASHLLPQLAFGPRYGAGQVHRGIGLFVFGLVKKVVIADNLSLFVDKVFSHPQLFGQWDILLGIYAFAFQIYCDFSGYTDMARGIAFVLGYDIGLNFNFPYFAVSIRDFWKRWHMSLSTWLRDYLYIPLGGNRSGTFRHFVNIMLTMLLGGLWHGANWTFVAWGGLHGIFICLEHLAFPSSPKVFSVFERFLRVFLTFHLVCATWVFFRADNFTTALEIFRRLFVPGREQADPTVAGYILAIISFDLVAQHSALRAYILGRPLLFWVAIWSGIFMYLIFGNFSGDAFVYFQF